MTIRVYPGTANPTHEISLSDGVQTWGLHLDGGPEALKETPLTPSTLRFNGSPSGFGEWEPGMAQIEQRDWSGGRGLETLSSTDEDAANRFYDSLNAWTLTPGKLLPAPQWKVAQGLRASIQHLPGNVSWKALIGEQRFVSTKFTVGVLDLAAKNARVWIRRVGTPNEIALDIYTDDGGVPGTRLHNLANGLGTEDAPDVISYFHGFDLELDADLTGGETFHVVISGVATDNAANHWEIGVEEKNSNGHKSADGDEWALAGFSLYFRLEDADIKRTFMFFRLGGSLYAVDQRANGSASHLYLNGDHGLTTSATATSLTNTNRFWVVDAWTGAWVRIVKGKGTGQTREIISNTAETLTVAAWDVQPDATSEYSIYGTGHWTDISPSSGDLIDGVVKDVAIVNDHALFAQGDAVAILRMRFNSALVPPRHEFDDDGTNMADLLHSFHHPVSGPVIWRGLITAGEISRAVPANWATAMTFGTAVKVGEKSQQIQELFDWNGQLWVLKGDSFWQVNDSDQAKRINSGLETIHRETPKPPICIFGGEVVLGWGHDLVAFSGSSLSRFNVGGEQGLPALRTGTISALAPMSAGRLAVGLDAGDSGESSVLLWEGDGWHELMRAPQAGQRVHALSWHEAPGCRPRLWIGLDGDLAYIDLPGESSNPLADQGLSYQHEAVLVGGTIDMGAARLPKFLKELSLVSRNLNSETRVELDYQIDGEIGTTQWRHSKSFDSSPLDVIPMNLGQLQTIRPRLRLVTNQAKRPPIVETIVLDGFARTPLRYQWTIRIRVADLQADPGGGLEGAPDEFMAWLQQAARQARKIHMRAIWGGLDDKYVIVEPPTLLRQFGNSLLSWWGGVATVVLREG